MFYFKVYIVLLARNYRLVINAIIVTIIIIIVIIMIIHFGPAVSPDITNISERRYFFKDSYYYFIIIFIKYVIWSDRFGCGPNCNYRCVVHIL